MNKLWQDQKSTSQVQWISILKHVWVHLDFPWWENIPLNWLRLDR